MPSLEPFLTRLNLIFEAPKDEKVPELFSGRPTSPLWFVAINPRGAGTRPTYADVEQDPQYYERFYENRFEGLDLIKRCKKDAYGNPLSKTVGNYLEYIYEFCDGARVPVGDRWQYVMKTNKFGTHARKVSGLWECRCIYPLDIQAKGLTDTYRPAIVVTVGSWAKGMLSSRGTDLPGL